MATPVPIIDLTPWFAGTAEDRADLAHRVDLALQDCGFLLITGHQVPADLPAKARRLSREFFALPEAVKRGYAVAPGGRGWLPPGVEANGFSEGTPTPDDLKESFASGSDQPTGIAEVDAVFYPANNWPAEVPELRAVLVEYLARMRALADQLLRVCAAALDLPDGFFADHAQHPTYTLNVNRYPPLTVTGPPAPGQYRIGPHTDFGTVTVLDREPGVGGLQVYTADGQWVDAPFQPGALTVNIGDMMARWTGDRWRSARHRVLPPDASAPDEELVSLIYFFEADHDAVVTSLPAPIGRTSYEPIIASEYLREKLESISVG